MSDELLTPFEQRLATRLRAHAERAVTPVDAVAVARSVAIARPSARALMGQQRPPPRVIQFAIVCMLVLAFVATAILVGAFKNPLGRNGLIAFTTKGSIAVANPDGSDLRILTPDSAEDSFPVWSPDGSKLAYWSKRSNLAPLSLGVLDPRTGVSIVVTGSLNIQSDPAPISWAPDGRRLVFKAIIGQGDREVYVVGADGSDLQSLASELRPSDPVWSPDSTQIAFRGRNPSDLATFGLDIMNADGTDQQALVTWRYESSLIGPWTIAQFNWSPDGTRIAYASAGPLPVGGWVIAVIDVRTGVTRDVTPGDFDGLPFWSPDGEWIAFSRGRRDRSSDGTGAASNVWLVRPDGADLHILTSVQIAAPSLSWSPDGTHVVAYSPDLTEVVEIPLDGSPAWRFPAPGADAAPSWQRLP